MLNVNSILVDREQAVQILLTGSLKRKTDMDRILDQVGSKTFDEIARAIVERFS